MEGMQIALPVIGIVAAAAVTFYAISFAELREVLTVTIPFSSPLPPVSLSLYY